MIELFILGKLISIERENNNSEPTYWFPSVMALAQVVIWPITLFIVMRKLWAWNLVVSLVIPAALAVLSIQGTPMNYVYYGVFAVLAYMVWLVVYEALTEGRENAMMDSSTTEGKK